MQTHLAPEYQNTPQGIEAEMIVRKCVHCGFCSATCPSYLVLGDELDGPRGRIYLIKQLLEGATPTRTTQQHLDRCLTCRNCETTCPSGVPYARLADIGREIVETKVSRPLQERVLRSLLKHGLTSAAFGPALRLGQWVRALLPATLQAKVPHHRDPGLWPKATHQRKVLLLAGCVQPALSPNINFATARVLHTLGVQTEVAAQAGCCGALKYHLNDPTAALAEMRRNIDAWWPWVEAEGGSTAVEAIVMNASGCGVMVKDYGHLLRNDPKYAEKARQVSALTQDLSTYVGQHAKEFVPLLQSRIKDRLAARRVAYHPPCTLQHGQQIKGGVERLFAALGCTLHLSANESHLCCGSAGTYSVLQPEIALQLRDRKLSQLGALQPELMVSANIGCITHLQSGTATPVRHWVELLDEAIVADHAVSEV
jgi:glycolate oxidase iron-sulfur subunit